MRKKIKIGLFGFGCVGQGLYEILEKTPSFNAEIRSICVKDRTKERLLPAERFIYHKDLVLNDPEINVIVELIDDAEAAWEIVSGALKNGKAVVSANKKMIAQHLDELIHLQRTYNAPLLYEAACCASIPVIRNLEEYYDNDLLESIEGIINGSTNFILTRTSAAGVGYHEALCQAQALGFAESDPSLDVSGQDAANKLVILVAHAFGIIVKREEILTCGIENIGPLELSYAREKNLRIKLVARAYRQPDGSINAFVLPQFIGNESWLYSVNDEFNGVITRNTFSDTQFFVGKGAGSHPTASAVLSDLSALTYDYRYEYKKLAAEPGTFLRNEDVLRIFCRFDKINSQLVEEYFIEVEESYSQGPQAYITGLISLDSLNRLSGPKIFFTSVILLGIPEVVRQLETIEADLRSVP
jgi:homoserine dehydrogenase